MTLISTAEPSLSSRAMLCSLSISMWSARKHDRDASEEIAQRHGAQPDAGRYHKVLLPKAAFAEIQKIVSEARQEHYFMTLPWDDNGYARAKQKPQKPALYHSRQPGLNLSTSVEVNDADPENAEPSSMRHAVRDQTGHVSPVHLTAKKTDVM